MLLQDSVTRNQTRFACVVLSRHRYMKQQLHLMTYSIFFFLFFFFNLLLSLQCLFILADSQDDDYDFFYFVQQWPGSHCNTNLSCCYPTTGKPQPDFVIRGLWPNYSNGSYPSYCDPNNPFDPSEIEELQSDMEKYWPTLTCPSEDGTDFWEDEWNKHGTCSEEMLDQDEYFEAALWLKKDLGLLQTLINAGINPNGSSYSLESIKHVVKDETGVVPWIECNTDYSSGNSQLYQVYMCVERSGLFFIDCPVFPSSARRCSSQIEFPSF